MTNKKNKIGEKQVILSSKERSVSKYGSYQEAPRYASATRCDSLQGRLILFAILFSFSIFSCTQREKESSSTKVTDDKESSSTEVSDDKKEPILEKTEVRWMYMDDSLRNICRPLNFILPWMASDERELPDTVYHEITRLPPFKYFSAIGFDKEIINDSLVSYRIKMANESCGCSVIRYYEGNKNNKAFDGYRITEQVICNASSANDDLLHEKKGFDSDKVAEHGHDH